MAHIHTGKNERDTVVSAFIIRMQDDEPLCLVHLHRKYQRLMQPGGHIELTETPWGAMEHELQEETGYTLGELSVLQPAGLRLALDGPMVTHPLPLIIESHSVKDAHFHTNISYGFVARTEPLAKPAEGESEDIRWLTLSELKQFVDEGLIYENVYAVFHAIITHYLEAYDWLPATDFSVKTPLVHR